MPSRSVPVLATSILLALAGCLGSDAGPETVIPEKGTAAPDAVPGSRLAPLDEARPFEVAASANASGSSAGAKEVAYPYRTGTGAQKEPVAFTLEGAFEPKDCTLIIADVAGDQWKSFPIHDRLEPGDVFSLRATLRFTNADDSWGDIHLFLEVPGMSPFHQGGTSDARGEVVQVLEAQSAWKGEQGQWAGLGVACFFGFLTKPIAFTVDVEIAYARDVAPVGMPMGFDVPPGATRLIVTGRPLDPSRPVTGHYRIFDTQDRPLAGGFFGLTSQETESFVPVAGTGEHVILVEHVENGFLSLAVNAKPEIEELRILSLDYQFEVDLEVDPAANVDESAPFTLDRMPLEIFAFEIPDGAAGFGKAVTIEVDSPVGNLLHFAQGGFLNFETPEGGYWVPLPFPGWNFTYDHHALAPGEHVVKVRGEAFAGRVFHVVETYLRTGESEAELPTQGGGKVLAINGRLLRVPAEVVAEATGAPSSRVALDAAFPHASAIPSA